MRDSEKKIITVGDLGVGGGERHCHKSTRFMPFRISNTIQRCYKNNLIFVGKVSIGQFGNVYHEQGIAPTICAGTHGYCVGHILTEKK